MGKKRERKRSSRRNDRNDNRRENGNVIAMKDHANTPQRSRKSKVTIVPRSVNQEDYVFAMEDNVITFGIGPAGTGKTLLATLKAIESLKNGEVERIIITRPAVGVDGEAHGFLPGTLIEKMAPWTRPIFDVFEEYFSPPQLENMIENGVIEVSPLAYMRGRTFKNAFVIFDEAQNSTPSQMKMALTRIGDNSQMVITGDLNQHDRGNEANGLLDFMERLEARGSQHIAFVRFEKCDIERHPVIDEVLDLYDE